MSKFFDGVDVIRFGSTDEWLQARTRYFTATMVADLMAGRKSDARLRDERAGLVPGPGMNRYFAWGHEREPKIIEYAQTFIDSRVEPNDGLYVSRAYPEFACTPDGVAMDGEDVEFLVECKTTKELSLTDSPLYERYLFQVQWQLLVTGATAAALVWESYTDDGDWFTPIRTKHKIIHPDRDVFVQMIDRVEQHKRFCAENPPGEEQKLPPFFEYRCMELLKLEDEAKRLREELRSELTDWTGENDISFNNAELSISLSTPKPTKRFQQSAFKKVHPSLYQEFVQESQGAQRFTVKGKNK